MDYGLRYFISKNKTDWINLSEIINSKNTELVRNLCTNSFKSAVDTATFTLIGNVSAKGSGIREQAILMLMEALENASTLYAKVEIAENPIFLGIVDLSSFSIESSKVEGNVVISCRDISSLYLDDAIQKNIFYENKKVSEVVISLLSEAGYATGKNEIEDVDDYTLPAFVIDPEEDSRTYRDVIDTLLFEAGGYVIKANEEGWIDILRIPSTPPDEQPDGIDYAVSSGLSSKASMLDTDGLNLEWSTLAETDDNQTVYVDTISRDVDDNGNVIGVEIENGGYFPEDGDITPSYQEFDASLLDREYNTGVSRKKNSDLTIICVRNVSAEIIASDINGNTVDNSEAWDYPVLPSLGMEKNPTIWPLKAWYLLKNKYGSVLNLQQFVLHGRVLYRNKVFHTVVPSSAKSPEEYTSTYIFNQAHAERFSKFYWHFKKFSRVVHTWVDYEYGNKEIGSVVAINHKGTSAGQPALIVQASIGFEGGRIRKKFSALSIGEFTEYEVKNWGTSPNYNVDKPADPLMPKRQYAVFPSPSVEDLFTSAIIYTDSHGSSWFLIDGAAVIAESISDADWSDTVPPVPDGQYLFCREWNYVKGDWDYYRLTGDVGEPARDFTLSANPSLFYNSKRRKGSTSISIIVTTLNLSETAQKDFILKTSGVSISDNVITIPEGAYPEKIVVDVVVTDLDTGYGPVTKTIEIQGMTAEDGKPIYLGVFSENPNEAAYSYNFIEGDYYWNKESHLAYRYSEDSEGNLIWRIAENTDSNFSEIMSVVTADAFSGIEPGSTTLAQFGYFENIIAEYIQAEMIETMNITLRDGGVIKSEGYDKGDIDLSSTKTGFYLDGMGYSEFQDMRVRNIEAIGSFYADALRTINNIPLISYEQVLPEYQEEWKECGSTTEEQIRCSEVSAYQLCCFVNKGSMYWALPNDITGTTYDIYWSDDYGNTWHTLSITNLLDPDVKGLKVLNGRFIAIAKAISTQNYFIIESVDGKTITQHSLPVGYTCFDITYGNGVYAITVREEHVGDYNNGILYSADLTEWEYVRVCDMETAHPIRANSHIMYNTAGFIVDGDDGLYLCTSSSFTSWQKVYQFTEAPRYTRMYFLSTDRYVIEYWEDNAYILTSTDGYNWNSTTLILEGSLGFPSAVLEDGIYHYTVTDTTGGDVYISTNTVSWQKEEINTPLLTSVYMQNGIYLAFSSIVPIRVFWGSICSVKNIYDFFSLIRPKLNTELVDMPLAEPLVNPRAVTGSLEYMASSFSIEQMKCSDNEIVFKVTGSDEEIRFVADGAYPLSVAVKNLLIEQISGELQTGNMYPMDDSIETNIGSDEHPYEHIHGNHIHAEDIEGDLQGNVQGNVQGNLIGNLLEGNVNSENNRTEYQVWGAVFN